MKPGKGFGNDIDTARTQNMEKTAAEFDPARPLNRRTRLVGWALPALLLLVGLALRVTLAWQDYRVLLAEYLWYDDSFLALSIAHNLAHGHGMTCDGVNVTNGFQPLYVFLLVPFLALIPEHNLTLPIHVAATLLAFAGTAAAGLFYLIARRLYSRTAALCVLFLFTASTYFVAMDVNGLETAVYGLTLSGTLYYYLTRFSAKCAKPSLRQGAAFGVLCGLTLLTRIDAAILILCMMASYLWARRGDLRAACGRVAVGAIGGLAVVAPWFLTSAILCRSIIPVSGPAVRWASSQIGWIEVGNFVRYEGPPGFPLDEVPWQYYANYLLHLSAQGLALLPITAQVEGHRPVLVADKSIRFTAGKLIAKRPWAALSLILSGAAVAAVFPLLTRRRGRSPRTRLGGVSFLRIAMIAWLAAYVFYVFGPWHSYRYLYPVLAILTLFCGAVIDPLLARLRAVTPFGARLVLGAAALSYSFLFFNQAGHYYTCHRTRYEPDKYTPVLPWLERNLPSGTTIASFQSGVLNYFAPFTCINLDGVVNANALNALQEDRMWSYIREQGITYIVDWPVVVRAMLGISETEARQRLNLVYDEHPMRVFRVHDL